MSYIEIKLKSDMCMGSGESGGNTVDTDICMDDTGLPYIPARRIKGCLRQSAEQLRDMGDAQLTQDVIDELFGTAFGKEGQFTIENAFLDGYDQMHTWLRKREKDFGHIGSQDVVGLFSYVRGQTKLENGMKVDNTLRFTRVLSHYNPLYQGENKETTFYARLFVEDENKYNELLERICKATRHVGTNRNRGLGNVACVYHREDITKKANVEVKLAKTGDNEKIWKITYKLVLDSPLTLPGIGELNTEIAARSVIGCLARQYLKNNSADDGIFADLFLNGKVNWSNLTPVIDGEISRPTPLMLVKLKNGGGKIVNRFSEKADDWKKLKPKTMEGSYTSVIKDEKESMEYRVAVPNTHIIYHNRLSGEKQLYMQEYIDAGAIYGGSVSVEEKYVDIILGLIKNCHFRFGRSKGAQYSTCTLEDISIAEHKENRIKTNEGEPIFVVLESDMICDNGCYIVGPEEVRAFIADKIGVNDVHPNGYDDICNYSVNSGFNAMWQLQRPHVPVVRGGSVYCFEGNGSDVCNEFIIGEAGHEGFGRCHVYTLEELASIVRTSASEVSEKMHDEDPEITERLEGILLAHKAIEQMKEYANEIWQSIKKGKKQYPIGRMRQMLSDSSDLQDLKNRINDMKESDLSSEQIESRREICNGLVDMVYGKNVFESIRKQERREKLFSAVEGNKIAKEIVEENWKIMLENIMHNAHYGK